MRTPPKGNRLAVNISLTQAERDELQRLAAEESARDGKLVSVSEFIRRRTLGRPTQAAA